MNEQDKPNLVTGAVQVKLIASHCEDGEGHHAWYLASAHTIEGEDFRNIIYPCIKLLK